MLASSTIDGMILRLYFHLIWTSSTPVTQTSHICALFERGYRQLILWQIGTMGDWTYKRFKYDTSTIPLLVQKLSQFYPMSHLITVYEAPMFPGIEPMISQIPVYSLIDFPITAANDSLHTSKFRILLYYIYSMLRSDRSNAF
jgi:hypothetical protein